MGMTVAAWPAGARRWPARLAWALWGLTLLGLAATARFDQLLRQVGLPELALLTGGNLVLVVAGVSAATVGALLAGLASGLVILHLSVAGFVLLLTPTGRLPSPRWRRWARVMAAATVVGLGAATLSPRPLYPEYPDIGSPIGVAALRDGPLGAVFPLCALLVLVGLVVGAGSLVGRFRRARGLERQQLKWLALTAVLAAMLLVLGLASLLLQGAVAFLFQASLAGCIALLPLAIGAAITRYRLYDIDRIISRTVAYGLLTVLLGLGYAAVVLGLGGLLPRDSSLVVAAATLAVAGLFQPLRRRVQGLVDRRFNRRRYDAARTLDGFARRLRDQVDLDALHGELLAVVDQTMQPTRASLWLRPRPPPEPAAAGAKPGFSR
jgi:hypothetical protein